MQVFLFVETLFKKGYTKFNMNSKALFFRIFLVVVVSSSLFGAEKKSPNFLFILMDDLGWADVGFNNPQSFYETPNLDKLAESSVVFSNAYSVSSVCSPSRFGIETGRYPTRDMLTNFLSGKRTGKFAPALLNENISKDEICLAQKMKEQNYITFFAGKYHLGKDEASLPDKRGYDINKGGMGAGSPVGKYYSPYKNPKLIDGIKGEYLPERITREAQEFLKSSKEGKPFFAMVAYYLVHTPLVAPESKVKKYADKAQKMGLDDAKAFRQIKQIWATDDMRKERVVQSNPTYAAMVEVMDDCVGKLMNTLKEENLLDDTVIIFFSDNGGLSTGEAHSTSNMPLKAGKGWNYEGGIRVPMLISIPKKFLSASEKSTDRQIFKCNTPVSGIDFFPTICELGSVKISHKIDGDSLVKILSKQSEMHSDIYWHYPHYSNQGGLPSGAIRSGDWKLIESFEDGSCELFNLVCDISETTDIAQENPEKVKELKAKLHAWYKSVDAKFLEPLGENKNPWRPQD